MMITHARLTWTLALLVVAVGAGPALADPQPQPCDGRTPLVPAALLVPRELQPHFVRMLRRSATFRAQCRRIAAAPGLTVRVRLNLSLDPARMRARSVIMRIADGGMVVAVELSATGNPTEWIAHELEHVLEQLEGIRLERLADRGAGVWWSGEAMFETARAIAAGRVVRDETRRPSAVESDIFVEE